MYVSVNGCAFWLPSTLQKWTNHSLLFNVSSVCWIMSCHLFRHHPGADSTRAQVRPEQHMLISVFKLNSLSFASLNIRARGRELARTVRKTAPQNARIKLSLKYCVWMDKFTQKFCQNARLGKYPIADIQCPPLILAPLVNMTKGGCENKSALFILFIFHSKNSQNSNLSLKLNNWKWGENLMMK